MRSEVWSPLFKPRHVVNRVMGVLSAPGREFCYWWEPTTNIIQGGIALVSAVVVGLGSQEVKLVIILSSRIQGFIPALY